jgi:hypothetical protein
MATYTKHLLSASTSGRGILVTATGTNTPTLIHTAQAGTNSLDELYLYASNMALSNGTLAVCWGGTVFPNDITTTPLLPGAGRVLVMDGRLIQDNLVVSAYSNGTAVVVDGFVNRITT